MQKPALILFVLAMLVLHFQSAWAWDSRRLATPLVVDDLHLPYPEFALFMMPGQRFSLHFKDAQAGGQFSFEGVTAKVGSQQLTAPKEPGHYPLVIDNVSGNERAHLTIFVMHPASSVDSKGLLNGYRIGSYPSEPLRGNPLYLPPKGFVEVTKENHALQVSPNFTLGEFVSKQNQGYPRYLVLRSSLLLKLENILATLNLQGKPVEKFTIMSGYRTPWYNRSIGNVPYSRHCWGGAADFYIDDNPRDGRMDDLNGDGKINRADAQWLATFIDSMSHKGAFGRRIGGLGVYGSNSAHGPFVHVDVRGERARW